MNGFFDGFAADGEPSGLRPVNAAKLAGVRSVELAGSGRPVSFAIAVRTHLMTVYMPSTEPSVCRKLPNCSATETMAADC